MKSRPGSSLLCRREEHPLRVRVQSLLVSGRNFLLYLLIVTEGTGTTKTCVAIIFELETENLPFRLTTANARSSLGLGPIPKFRLLKLIV